MSLSEAELIEKVRHDIAREHDILIDKDDPILLSVLINKRVLDYYLHSLTRANEAALREEIELRSNAFKAEVAQVNALSSELAKQSLVEVVEATGQAFEAKCNGFIETAKFELKSSVIEAHREANEQLLNSVAHERQQTKHLALIVMTGISLIFSLAALGLVLFLNS